MAKQVAKSGLAAKLNQKRTQQVEFEVPAGGGGFPKGIEGGIAEITKIGFGTFKADAKKNAGEQYFMVYGVIVQPAEHAGIQGSLIMEAMVDTPERKTRPTLDEKLDYVIGILQNLGLDTSDVDFATDLNIDGGELSAELASQRLTCRFRTWAGDKQVLENREGKWFVGTNQYASEGAARLANPYLDREPMVNVVYMGACQYESDGPVDRVVDNSPTTTTKPAAKAKSKDNSIDFAGLGVAADEGDEDAQKQLEKMANDAGLSPDEIPTWGEVAEQLMNPPAAEEGGDEEAPFDEDSAPSVNQCYWFKAPRTKVFVEYDVTKVDAKNHTVMLKDLATSKAYKEPVGWGELYDDKKGTKQAFPDF